MTPIISSDGKQLPSQHQQLRHIPMLHMETHLLLYVLLLLLLRCAQGNDLVQLFLMIFKEENMMVKIHLRKKVFSLLLKTIGNEQITDIIQTIYQI